MVSKSSNIEFRWIALVCVCLVLSCVSLCIRVEYIICLFYPIQMSIWVHQAKQLGTLTTFDVWNKHQRTNSSFLFLFQFNRKTKSADERMNRKQKQKLRIKNSKWICWKLKYIHSTEHTWIFGTIQTTVCIEMKPSNVNRFTEKKKKTNRIPKMKSRQFGQRYKIETKPEKREWNRHGAIVSIL